MRPSIFLAALCLAISYAAPAPAREWKDATGGFKIEAEFVRVAGEKVELRKADGAIVAVPIAKLSKADQEFLQTQKSTKTWLTDLPEKDVSVGHGTFGKHGNLGFADRKITFKGEPSPHGLGMHPPPNGQAARVRYELDGKYGTFRGSVSINDTGERGSDTPVYFRVLGIQKKAYPAPAEEGLPDTVRIELTVDGTDKLTLTSQALTVTHVAGAPPPQVLIDETNVDPRAHPIFEVSTPLLTSIDLRDVTVTKVKGRGKLTTKAEPLELEFTLEDLDAGSDLYVIEIKVRECGGIFGMWESHPLFMPGHRQDFAIDVRGIDELRLEVKCDQRIPNRKGHADAHAVWLEPQLDTAPPPTDVPLPWPGTDQDRWLVSAFRREVKARQLLYDRKFDELNAVLHELRTSKRHPPWVLVQLFYGTMRRPAVEGADSWEKHLALLKSWREHSPKASGPLASLGRALHVHAWFVRGAIDEEKLSAEAREAFFAEVKEAEDYLREALEQKDADPDPYSALLVLAGEKKVGIDAVEALLREGMAVDPTWYPLYAEASRALLPGNTVDDDYRAPSRLADKIRTRLAGAAGDRAYAEMALAAGEVQNNRFMREYGFEYAKYQKAIVPLLRDRRFERLAPGIFFEQALRHDDLETARIIMPYTFWSEFREKTWAQGDTYFSWIAFANPYRPQLKVIHWRASDYNLPDMQWTPDGKEIISFDNLDGRIKQWTIVPGEKPVGKQIYSINHRDQAAALDPHKRFLAAGAIMRWGQQITIHSLEEKREIGRLGPGEYGYLLAVSCPDGKKFATSSLDGTINVANYEAADEPIVIPRDFHANSMAFSPDGKRLLSQHYNGTVVVWELAGEKIKGEQRVNAVKERVHHGGTCWSRTGRYLAAGNDQGVVRVWDEDKKAEYPGFHKSMRFLCAEFSHDEKFLFVGCSNGEIRVIDFEKRNMTNNLRGHWSAIRHLRLSPDGKTLASGSIDGTIALWDTAKVLKGVEK
jgi:hypothetical protein